MPINRARLGVAVTLALCCLPIRAEAQCVVICLRNGVQLNAERFEARGDTFSVFVAGNKAPVEYPASAISGINIPCPASAASTPQPQTTAAATTTDQGRDGFGIHGSNTIGERLMPRLVEAYSQAQYGARPIVRLGGLGHTRESLADMLRSKGYTVAAEDAAR